MGIPEDSEGWLALVRKGMPPFWRLIAEGTGGRVWEEEGVLAAIVPSSPSRSFFNSVLYEDPGRLIASIDKLADVYAEAGVLFRDASWLDPRYFALGALGCTFVWLGFEMRAFTRLRVFVADPTTDRRAEEGR